METQGFKVYSRKHSNLKTMAPLSKAEKLPQELISDILSKLPAKSVGQLRCVSRHWHLILTDPQFIKAHLNIHFNQEQDKLITVSESQSLHVFTFNQNGNDGIVVSRKLDFQHLLDNWVTVGGSCNGLVLAVNEKKMMYLINPLTLEYHDISNPDMVSPGLKGFIMYGFGYDVGTDDYKVVTLTYHSKGQYKNDVFTTCVDVYSLRKGVWGRLFRGKESLESLWGRLYSYEERDSVKRVLHWSAPDRDTKRFKGSPDTVNGVRVTGIWVNGVLVNGALHWLATKRFDDSSVIVGFDISDEKFYEVPAPTTLDKGKFVINNIAAINGCLCMLSDTPEIRIFWMMKDYGVEESWTKFKVKGPGLGFTELTPLCLISEDDVVLSVCGQLIIYNRREDWWRDIMDDEILSMSYRAGTRTFRESLLPPTFGMGT